MDEIGKSEVIQENKYSVVCSFADINFTFYICAFIGICGYSL